MQKMTQQRHRSFDELTRQILHFLYVNGASSILQIEYAVEINSRQTRALLPDLLSSHLIVELLPGHAHFKKVRTNTVARLFEITAKGKKCMHLMNNLAQQLNTPVNVQYNVRRAGYFLPSADAAISKTQGKV